MPVKRTRKKSTTNSSRKRAAAGKRLLGMIWDFQGKLYDLQKEVYEQVIPGLITPRITIRPTTGGEGDILKPINVSGILFPRNADIEVNCMARHVTGDGRQFNASRKVKTDSYGDFRARFPLDVYISALAGQVYIEVTVLKNGKQIAWAYYIFSPQLENA